MIFFFARNGMGKLRVFSSLKNPVHGDCVPPFPYGRFCLLSWLLHLMDVESSCHAPAVGRAGCTVLGSLWQVFFTPKWVVTHWQESFLLWCWSDPLPLAYNLSALVNGGFFCGGCFRFFCPQSRCLLAVVPSLGSCVDVRDLWHVQWG